MTHTAQYERILDELASGEMDELQTTIFAALRKAYPHGRTRRQLICDVFGYQPAENEDLNNSKEDRKIRLAIAKMFDGGVPIVSGSGEAGYRIDISEHAIIMMIAELESRKEHTNEKIRAAQKTLLKVRQLGTAGIPHEIVRRENVKQLGLFMEAQ